MADRKCVDWKEVRCTRGMAPWIAEMEGLQLCVQPYYGDGIHWKGIIKHTDWTVTLHRRFPDMPLAMIKVEEMAKKMLRLNDE